ncbi:MAG: PPC domain-containing DNA-binding protein [Bryobacteraceae bacterium]|nr:PPC domain-containing DNA-binding protein [Bryobacteraceae bacterium]
MKRVLIALLLAAALHAQVKKTEVVKSTSAAEDGKGLSPNVPDSVALSTRIERVVLVRFRNQADILAGLEKHVKEQRIRNAVILSGFGSVVAAHYHVVSNRSFPSKNLFVENPTANADVVNFSGAVLNGRLHPHITFADADKAYGGHLEPRTLAFTFAVIVLGVLPDDIDVSRFDDKNWR